MGMDEDVDRTIFQDEFLPALTVAGRTWRSIFRQDFMEPQLASESPLPCLRTAPHLPAWWLLGLSSLPLTRESSLEACRGPSSPPQAAPKLTMFQLHPPGAA